MIIMHIHATPTNTAVLELIMLSSGKCSQMAPFQAVKFVNLHIIDISINLYTSIGMCKNCLTFSPLDPSQRRVFRPRPRTTPFAATGYVVPKRTLLYESIIVHTHYSLNSVNILHVINRFGSKISIIFYH